MNNLSVFLFKFFESVFLFQRNVIRKSAHITEIFYMCMMKLNNVKILCMCIQDWSSAKPVHWVHLNTTIAKIAYFKYHAGCWWGFAARIISKFKKQKKPPLRTNTSQLRIFNPPQTSFFKGGSVSEVNTVWIQGVPLFPKRG